jgi:hypothetical protein
MIQVSELAPSLCSRLSLARHRKLRPVTPGPLRWIGPGSMLLSTGLVLALAMIFPAFAADDAGATPNTADQVSDAATAEAVATLKRMHDYLRNRTDLEFRTTFSLTTEIPANGTRGSSHFQIRQPNLFRVEAVGGNASTVYVSDGKTVTIFRSKGRRYTQVMARDTIIGTMYSATGVLAEQARIVDFFWTVDYLTIAGEYVRIADKGVTETIAGRQCRRISVDRMHDSWEVWVAQADPPLPCKLVSRRRDDPSVPVHSNEFTWTTNPIFTTETFSLPAPPGSQKVEGFNID